MAETVDELTVEWEEGGDKVVRELAKEIMSKGAWATVAFLSQDLDRKTRKYKPPKISIRRYRKVDGQYRYQSKFNISSEKQALQLVDIIQNWFADEGVGKNAPADPGEGDLTDPNAAEAVNDVDNAAPQKASESSPKSSNDQ